MEITGLEVSDRCPDKQKVDKAQRQFAGVFV
jgi:hypothetical protein